ncbi:MAG TPA: GntR family transcriptional regulator [Acidimicrobiales bacterium]|nr:GntR family transcriptional regulator [Acidimicrobiales bacterium]
MDEVGGPNGSVAIAEHVLRTETLRSQAIRAIRAAIIVGELAPGEVHSARELAAAWGISATPVREAFLELARERLVEPVQNRGFRIVEVSEEDLREIAQLRVFVEVPAVGGVTGLLDDEAKSELSALVDEIETSAGKGDLSGYLDADRRFHIRLVEPLQNRRLAELLGLWRDQARLWGMRRLVQEDSLLATACEHRAILGAVTSGKRADVERLMREHLRHTRGLWAGLPEPRLGTDRQ